MFRDQKAPLIVNCEEVVSDFKIQAIDLTEFLNKKLAPREYLLAPWLPKAGLCMVYAARGVGKTFFALEVTMAVACGTDFLSFKAPKPAKVLYIDGEMPANVMQERLIQIKNRIGVVDGWIEPLIITPDLQETFMPDLRTYEGQQAIEDSLKNVDLIIVDHLSTLAGSGKENEADSWFLLQKWALNQRRLGKSVIFIHHAGKSGTQRGTSKREDILDTVIALRHPHGYKPDLGACFEVHFEKSRCTMGNDVNPISCQLVVDEWRYEPLKEPETNYKHVIELANGGCKQSEIVKKLGISKGQVSKIMNKGRVKGEIN